METKEERTARLTRNTRNWRARNPDKVKASRARMYKERRVRVFNLLGGAACRNCGCDELSFLELNHKNGGGSKELRQVGNRLYDLLLKGERNPDNYEVLCRVCNAFDHLQRKDTGMARGYFIRWQNFTGKTVSRIAQ